MEQAAWCVPSTAHPDVWGFTEVHTHTYRERKASTRRGELGNVSAHLWGLWRPEANSKRITGGQDAARRHHSDGAGSSAKTHSHHGKQLASFFKD